MPPNLPQTLRPLLRTLEDDIRTHANSTEEIHAHLLSEHQRARQADRTAFEFTAWQDEQVTLSAVAWILACVFIRFSEDNGLIEQARLAGEGDRLAYAEEETTHYFDQHPTDSDREYLLWVFAEAAQLPGTAELFDPAHNPLFKLPPSVDGAKALLSFWRKRDPKTGELALSFAGSRTDTRFLGDLYQDLSEDAKKRYALLQTPHFIESFILDRTLEPAIGEFGLQDTDLIDPACGSGHFLLGAFERLLGHWKAKKPQTSVRALCQRALDQIAGVDINPYAVAIARFRLLVAALNDSGVTQLKDAPEFKIHLTTGDSLLHGQRPGQLPGTEQASALQEHQHLYEAEDRQALRKILDHKYAAVVANPPYITPKDPAARDAYREIYSSCKGKYALSVPFMERLFDLARPSDGRTPAGFIGQITSNSFMKREFGKKLVEEYLPKWDLTHLIDTSGAHIPGHATATVILLARSRPPNSPRVRGVLGIRGEIPAPVDAATGKVWMQILEFVDMAGREGEFVSTEDLDRSSLATHPWSLQGGGAGEVKSSMDAGAVTVRDEVESIGIIGISGMEDVVDLPRGLARRLRIEADLVSETADGKGIRDWCLDSSTNAYFPYVDGSLIELDRYPGALRYLWPVRSMLESRATFSQLTYRLEGRPWWEWHQISLERLSTPLAIGWAEVATHNHFAFDRVGRVFKQTGPILKLRHLQTTFHVAVIASLNSSSACFWMKQVFQDKGVGGIGGGIASEAWERRYQQNSSKLQRFPLPKDPPTELARRLDALGQELGKTLPAALLEDSAPSRELLDQGKARWQSTRRQMIALQEELDFRCYLAYGLTDKDLVYSHLDSVPEVNLGERAFEIALARKVAASETETRWFERHGSTPITEIPDHFPDDYKQLVQARLDLVEQNKSIRLIERPEYKRRWQTASWEEMKSEALRSWICDRLEAEELWTEPKLRRADQISDQLLSDQSFQTALALYRGEDAEPAKLVAKLCQEEAVPYLATLRYTESGMRKRAAWERTWELQRKEDAGGKVEIDVPPKYKQADFRGARLWKHRGKLDVPKERFISYPGHAPDGSDLYGWAGWDHEQRARALATQIVEAQDQQGAEQGAILELIAGLEELLPWVRQWHPDYSELYSSVPADYYETFIGQRLGRLGVAREGLGALVGLPR